jgi:hypothetical protein
VTDQQANILPFGKYKGRSIEEVLSRLSAMARRAGLIPSQVRGPESGINRGAEPQETPEHNALQVRFLDGEFCLRFLRYLVPNYDGWKIGCIDLDRCEGL